MERPKRKTRSVLPSISTARSVQHPLVSVAITSYSLSRLRDLKALFGSLRSQTYQNFEIVFVGERSRDLCSEVAGYARHMNMRIKVLFNDGPPGQSAARNLAIAQCTGEIVAFIDDDALAKRDWLETIVESFSRNKSLIAVGGTALPMWEDGEMSWFPEEFYWIIGCTAWTRWETNRKVSYVWGMNMAVRKEALQTCSFAWGHVASERGIKVGIEGDDAEFITRIARVTNRPVEFEPAMTVYHRVSKSRITLKFIRQKSFWVGYTRAVHNRTHPELGKGNERRLLFRITTRFLPMTLLTLVAKPILSMKRISLAAYSLAYLCLGYLAGSSWTSSYGSLIAAKYTR